MTYNQLRVQIQSDLARIDLVPQLIDLEVAKRVYFYNAENFGSMVDLDYSITTTPGVSIYPLPQYVIEVTGMWYLLGNNTWIQLYDENFETLVTWDDINPTVQSPPNNYSIYGNSFKLFATPDNQYPLRIACTKQIPAPVEDDDSNFWTNEAFALIEYATDAALARAYLGLPAMADEYDAMAARELERLIRESDAKQSTGFVTPHMV